MTRGDIKGNDIITLDRITKKPILVNDVSRIVTGGASFQFDQVDYNIEESVNRLLSVGLIRENRPKEYLSYFNIDDLKKILQTNGFSFRGASNKSALVDEVQQNIPDEEIIEHKKYKPFYVVTDEGEEALKKYVNVIWFYYNRYEIFGWQGGNNRFNSEYFFKNYDKNPIELLFDYYQDKDPEIAGKLLALGEDYEEAMRYAIVFYTINLNDIIRKSAVEVYYRDRYRNTPDRFLIDYQTDTSWIGSTFKKIYDKTELIDSFKSDCYIRYFDYKELVSIDLFSNIIQAQLENEEYDLKKYGRELLKIVDTEYPDDEPTHNEAAERDYRESMLQNAALLDLLIDHLDQELLESLKERIELRIEEWKKIKKKPTII